MGPQSDRENKAGHRQLSNESSPEGCDEYTCIGSVYQRIRRCHTGDEDGGQCKEPYG
jgi:hypothetical protein